MGRKRSTKAEIVKVAWKLFNEKGYEETTIDEIIAGSNTSKGSFYHYFNSKDELLSSLSELFDVISGRIPGIMTKKAADCAMHSRRLPVLILRFIQVRFLICSVVLPRPSLFCTSTERASFTLLRPVRAGTLAVVLTCGRLT